MKKEIPQNASFDKVLTGLAIFAGVIVIFKAGLVFGKFLYAMVH